MTAHPAAKPFLMRTAIVAELQSLADPARALQQQRYMKSAMPYIGATMPELRKLYRQVFKEVPLEDQQTWEQSILDLWHHAHVREMRYAAIALLLHNPYRKKWLTPAVLPLIREIIESGAWWDFVDNLATNAVGYITQRVPDEMYPILRSWAQDDNLWIRRTAILAQLKFRAATDTEFLFEAIEGSISDRDFFARKAIGWALREYSKTDPAAVIDYIQVNKERLSPLSKREGLKILRKQGLVQELI